MDQCTHCGQDIPDNFPYSAAEIDYAVGSWDGVRNGLRVTLRKEQVDVTVLDTDDCNYDNAGPAWKVISVMGPDDEKQFFKKTGHYSSYDGYVWDGPCKEVHPKTKTVVVYE